MHSLVPTIERFSLLYAPEGSLMIKSCFWLSRFYFVLLKKGERQYLVGEKKSHARCNDTAFVVYQQRSYYLKRQELQQNCKKYTKYIKLLKLYLYLKLEVPF